MEQQQLDRQAILSLVFTSAPPQGRRTGQETSWTRLAHYTETGRTALQVDPEFMAHGIAWNRTHGTVRDSQVAVPVLSATAAGVPAYVRENGLAHIVLLTPRQIEQALRYAWSLRQGGHAVAPVWHVVQRYLRFLERDDHRGRWNQTAVQFRRALKALYALTHTKPSAWAQQILFAQRYPEGSRFAFIAEAPTLPLEEVLEGIATFKVPALIADSLLGPRLTDPDALRIYMSRLTPTEVVRKTKKLQKLGVMQTPATRALFEHKLAEASTKTPPGVMLNTTRAAETLERESETSLGRKLRGVQERQMTHAQSIEGDWLFLGDCSPSMTPAIDIVRELVAYVGRLTKGRVHLIFFNEEPRYIDATGLSYEALVQRTRTVQASGSGTSIGCGLAYMRTKHLAVDGIAIVSDGGENRPPVFVQEYEKYSQWLQKEPPIYFYWVAGHDPDRLTVQARHLPFQKFDVNQVGPHGLASLAASMHTNRYSLLQEVYETPLLTLADVFPTRTEVLV